MLSHLGAALDSVGREKELPLIPSVPILSPQPLSDEEKRGLTPTQIRLEELGSIPLGATKL